MGSLDVLIRLAKQTVDQERLALMALNIEIAKVEQRIQDLKDMTASETVAGLDFMTSGATLTAFIRANKQRIQQHELRLQELRKRQDTQLECIRNERTELKRYELLAERRAKQTFEEVAAKEQRAIDELVVVRAGRRSVRE
jgi:flagellar export protein FliJ